MPPPAPQSPTSEVAWALREVQLAATRATSALAQRLGVGPTDLAALQHLAAAPVPLGPVELGHLLDISSASATVLVDRLEAAGHVTRAPHPADGRRRILMLTDRSRRSVLAALADLTSSVDRAASELTPDQAAATLRFLNYVAAAMRAYADDPR